MSGNIDTREFLINDYDAAVELWQRVEGLEIAEGDDRESVAQFLARNPGLSRLATDGSKTVGAALCGHDGRRGHIYHLAVDPAYQGRGLGKRLLDKCLEGLRRAGVKRVIIMWRTIIRAAAAFGVDVVGRTFRAQSVWELIFRMFGLPDLGIGVASKHLTFNLR